MRDAKQNRTIIKRKKNNSSNKNKNKIKSINK